MKGTPNMESTLVRCRAQTQTGQQCRKSAIGGEVGPFCSIHREHPRCSHRFDDGSRCPEPNTEGDYCPDHDPMKHMVDESLLSDSARNSRKVYYATGLGRPKGCRGAATEGERLYLRQVARAGIKKYRSSVPHARKGIDHFVRDYGDNHCFVDLCDVCPVSDEARQKRFKEQTGLP